jgi:hypothetical protein
MSHRCLLSFGALAAVVVLLRVAAAVPVASQGASLRTPWGEPDLQGIWNVMYDTPLERPERYEGREFLTDAEVAELDHKKAQDPGRNARGEAGSDQDVGGAYNAVFNSVLRTGKRTSLIVDPPDGRVPPLTPAAEKRLEMERAYLKDPANAPYPGTLTTGVLNRPAQGPEDRRTMERCLGVSMPAFGGGIFAQSTTIRIAQSPKQVGIYYEDNHLGGANRLIPVDGSPHLPAHMRRWLGDARGRWEGDTLVVDTTNFSGRTDFRGSRENLHLTERFTRVDANTLRREITIEDPTVWTRPWTVMIELGKGDDRQNLIFESACHEGNFGLIGILAGARSEERAAQTSPR